MPGVLLLLLLGLLGLFVLLLLLLGLLGLFVLLFVFVMFVLPALASAFLTASIIPRLE